MTKQEAIDIAASHAREMGWTWLEPVVCEGNLLWIFFPVYVVRTNVGLRGVNVVIKINATDGTIMGANFLPR